MDRAAAKRKEGLLVAYWVHNCYAALERCIREVVHLWTLGSLSPTEGIRP